MRQRDKRLTVSHHPETRIGELVCWPVNILWTGDSREHALMAVQENEYDHLNPDLLIARRNGDQQAIARIDEQIRQVSELEWPEQPSAAGYYAIASIHAGGIEQGGYEYRYTETKS